VTVEEEGTGTVTLLFLPSNLNAGETGVTITTPWSTGIGGRGPAGGGPGSSVSVSEGLVVACVDGRG